MAAAEENRRGLEAKVVRPMVEQTLLLLELEASRDEVSTLHSHAGKDKEAMVEDYQKALDHMFAYGYGCYAFKHGICEDRPRIPDGMPNSADPLPPELFCESRVPLDPNTRGSKGCRGTSGRNRKGFGGGRRRREAGLTHSLILVLGYFKRFL